MVDPPEPGSEARVRPDPRFWAVVPAGGAGTRLWPLSRQASPKFLHDLTGDGQSLLQDAVTRLRPLCGDNVLIVTGSAHAEEVRSSITGLPPEGVLVEPCPRDSLPAIGLAAAVLEREAPDAVLGSFAADHVIADDDRFRELVSQSVALAAQDKLVTLGITPTHAATGFGYLRPGSPWGQQECPGARRVEAFVEKPPPTVAQEYVRSGYLWNAGMFVVRVAVLMAMVERWEPALAAGLRAVAAEPGRMSEVWPTLPSLSIDRAVAERAAAEGDVVVVPADFGWDDIGDFPTLSGHWPPHPRHPELRVSGRPEVVFSDGSSGIVAAHGNRAVVTLGVSDIVVIDTPDAVLVTTREHAQDVRKITQILREHGREDLT